MSRKQIDFQLRVLEYNPTNPAQTTQAWSEYIRTQYLEQGWQIMNAEVTQVTGQTLYLAISFVKYEDDTESTKAKK